MSDEREDEVETPLLDALLGVVHDLHAASFSTAKLTAALTGEPCYHDGEQFQDMNSKLLSLQARVNADQNA